MAESTQTLPTVYTRSALQSLLAEGARTHGWSEGDSWSVVFISAVPEANELAALRAAAKLTDRVAVVRLLLDAKPPAKLLNLFHTTLQPAGADCLWLPTDVSGWLRITTGVDALTPEQATLLLQAITTVLPGLVVAPKTNVALVRALRNVLASLGELFSLRLV
jgi:hypothetical protein